MRGHNGWRNEHSGHVGTTLLLDCRSVRQRAAVTLLDQPRAKQEAQVRFNASSPPTLAPREGEGREERRKRREKGKKAFKSSRRAHRGSSDR